jgi:hypothetical protein
MDPLIGWVAAPVCSGVVGVTVGFVSSVESIVGKSVPSVGIGGLCNPPPRLNGRLVHPTMARRSRIDKNRKYRVSIKVNDAA